MKHIVALAVVAAACGGSSSQRAKRTQSSTSTDPPTSTDSPEPTVAPPSPVDYPAPPSGPAPTGTWRATLEYPRLVGRAMDVAVDGSGGVYLAIAVLAGDDVRMQRWSVVKLDASSAVAWSSVEELARSPSPERLVLADGALVVAGQDSTYEASRLLVIERRDTASGKQIWRKRFTARDASCASAGCAGKDTFGSLARHGSNVYFAASVDRPIEGAFGELSLAKGAIKVYATRSDRRGRDVGRDDSGLYILEDTMSNVVSLVKLEGPGGKALWTHEVPSGALQLDVSAGAPILWGKTVEKRAADTGELAWTSPLVGEQLDVAVDASGLYVVAQLAGKPANYYGLAKLNARSGAVEWVQRLSSTEDHRPATRIAVSADAVYVVGYDGELVAVEKRRKSDGALGDVTTAARSIDLKRKK